MSISAGGLDGKTALVTGAGRGIGRAIALGLAEAGARVVLLARSEGELDQVAGQVRVHGGRALVIPVDIGDPGQLAAAVKRTRAGVGEVDVLVNNAAVVGPLGASAGIDPAQWAAAISVNVVAAATLSFLLLPEMIAAGWGRIVNVSSGIAAHPAGMLRANAYATSKSALEAHTVNLAAELASTGVTVNAYRPGSVDTAMQAWIRGQDPGQIGAELHERFTASYEQGTLISPQLSARSLLVRLAGDAAGQIWNAADPA